MKRIEGYWLLPESLLIGVDQYRNEIGEQVLELCLGILSIRFVLK